MSTIKELAKETAMKIVYGGKFSFNEPLPRAEDIAPMIEEAINKAILDRIDQPSTQATYACFNRTWWKEATTPGWPNNLEPQLGVKQYKGHPAGVSYAEAWAWCKKWNASHEPGRYSNKAEFEEE